MKSEKEIRERIAELNKWLIRALDNNVHRRARHLREQIQALKWVLGE
ncbi:MAG: hypothetical protein ACE5J3_08710 [Methanosarcinales archaeon]